MRASNFYQLMGPTCWTKESSDFNLYIIAGSYFLVCFPAPVPERHTAPEAGVPPLWTHDVPHRQRAWPLERRAERLATPCKTFLFFLHREPVVLGVWAGNLLGHAGILAGLHFLVWVLTSKTQGWQKSRRSQFLKLNCEIWYFHISMVRLSAILSTNDSFLLSYFNFNIFLLVLASMVHGEKVILKFAKWVFWKDWKDVQSFRSVRVSSRKTYPFSSAYFSEFCTRRHFQKTPENFFQLTEQSGQGSFRRYSLWSF